MQTRTPASDPPLPEGMDYTDPLYWQGSIKLSLSRFFVLAVLARQPMHAYAVVQAVRDVTNGCCSPGEGTVYPMLKSFAQGGYLQVCPETVNGRQRRIYRLTARGEAAFAAAVAAWKDATISLLQSEVGEELGLSEGLSEGLGGPPDSARAEAERRHEC